MNIRKYIIIINLVGVLFYFGKSILNKETILSEGKLVLLELAPVDPRSLMQGDYMRLSYKIAQNVYVNRDMSNNDTITTNSVIGQRSDRGLPKRGALVIHLNGDGVGNGVRVYSETEPLKENELLVKYFKPDWSLNIGAESFFFQEGDGEKFENAKYGGLRIDEKGNSVLIGLYDINKKLIE